MSDIHPDYDKQQNRLPPGYLLWGNYGDGLWRVMPPGDAHVVTRGFATPSEAVDHRLAHLWTGARTMEEKCEGKAIHRVVEYVPGDTEQESATRKSPDAFDRLAMDARLARGRDRGYVRIRLDDVYVMLAYAGFDTETLARTTEQESKDRGSGDV